MAKDESKAQVCHISDINFFRFSFKSVLSYTRLFLFEQRYLISNNAGSLLNSQRNIYVDTIFLQLKEKRAKYWRLYVTFRKKLKLSKNLFRRPTSYNFSSHSHKIDRISY